jgi:multicomponent K+:H+ antiporter subunit D
MILQSASSNSANIWVWSVVLVASFLSLIGLARAGSTLFWSVLPEPPPPTASSALSSTGLSTPVLASTLGLLALGLMLAAGASPMKRYTDAAAAQLADRAAYANAVLGPLGGAAAETTRPYRGGKGEVILPNKGAQP